MPFAEFHTSTYPLRVLNIQRYMIHENTARTRTERVRVNTIHSLISLKKILLTNYATHKYTPSEIFSNEGMLEMTETLVSFFLMTWITSPLLCETALFTLN